MSSRESAAAPNKSTGILNRSSKYQIKGEASFPYFLKVKRRIACIFHHSSSVLSNPPAPRLFRRRKK
jgi:hypothetical protein